MDIDLLKSWIGKVESASEELTPSIVSRFTATFDMDGATDKGQAAPSLIHLCLCPPAHPTSELGPDGHPKRGGFLPPVPLPNRMWAGGAFSIHEDILIGETITRESSIEDVYLKEGSTGTLCFVEVKHKIYSGSRHALTELHNIVYKDQTKPGKDKAKTLPAENGSYTENCDPSSTFLFRYSALTFNGHRIHYDTPYAQEVEGYPGLIVHGPLQATLLFHFAEKIKGARPKEFRYRNLATIFNTSPFSLNAKNDGQALKMWTAQKNGPKAMDAIAVY